MADTVAQCDSMWGVDGLAGQYSAMAEDSNLASKAREAAMLFAVAEAHIDDDEGDEALKAATSALTIFREVADKTGTADTLRIIIKVYTWKHRYAEAERMAKEEMDIFKGESDKIGMAKMLLSLAEVKMEMPNRTALQPEALKAVTDARAIFQEAGDKKWEGNALLMLVWVHLAAKGSKAKKGKNAVQAAGEALDIFEEIGERKLEGLALHAMAISVFVGKLSENWLKTAKEALEIFERLMIGGWRLQNSKRFRICTMQGMILTLP